ncbi:MAG: amidohydrolase [Xanthobacteraceae bacterium]|nr:amidohydrolase [Xanthobacteraceae bacterium]
MKVRSSDSAGRPVLAAVIFLAVSIMSASEASAQTADLVFVNGKVFTANEGSTIAQAFAVKDGRFVAVGSSDAMRAHAGNSTKVIDLQGRFVTPGLSDGHLHGVGGGPGIDLSAARSLDDLFAVVARAAKNAEPGRVIVSNSDWHEAQLKEQRLPTAKELDQYAPANPVVLVRGGHEYILNSAALAHWGITKTTQTPPGGEIGRDADGELNGELVDNARSLVKLPAAPAPTIDGVLTTQRTLNAYGITSVRIPGNFRLGEFFQTFNLVLEARKQGLLTLRFNVYLTAAGPGGRVRDVQSMRDILARSPLKQDEGDEWVRLGGVKLGVDGGFEGGFMTQPFVGALSRGGTYYGINTVPASSFTAIAKMLSEEGWRVTTHAVGDAALDLVIGGYEAANDRRSIVGQRWSIEHLFVSRPDQLARLKKLDVALSVQNHLYLAAPSLKKYLGPERAARITPVRTYLDHGFLVVGGTDSPVVPVNPFWAIYHFLTRDTITDGVYGESERVASRIDLLRMFTINYAILTGEASIKGSIEPGKLADFAVLSDDLLAVPAQAIPHMKALATYVGGKEVYRDPSYK